jgi:hypothetical protein
MKVMVPTSMEFVYTLSGHGWEDGYIEVKENKRVEFVCSNISEGIAEMLERIYQLLANYPSSEINPNPMFWEEEPDATFWTLKKVGSEGLYLKVMSGDVFEGEKETILEEKVDLLTFAKAVTKQAELLLLKHGIIGYFETWGKEFPLAYFLRLKGIIEKVEISIHKEKPKGYVVYYKSNIDNEMDFISKITKDE